MDEEHGWKYHLMLNYSQTVTGVWWQSPRQAELTKWFNDILINDNTYNWNNSGYPLNVGVVIDNTGISHNAWYALHAMEDIAHHNWVLRCHLDSTDSVHPEIFASDRSQTLIASVEATLPLTDHIYCLHHLDGNVTTNVRGSLGAEWSNFQYDFWAAYRAVLPGEFDRLWNHLVTRYPSAQAYLDAELFPCHEQWAWAWVSFKFTAGVWTNGQVEAENRMNKLIGGPKIGLKQLFNRLNECTNGQHVNEMIWAREVCDSLFWL
jgi:MULE transposase domain